MRNGEFNMPLLVQIYDLECPWGRADDYFLRLVDQSPRSRVLDFGCGTGRLALALSAAGHSVTGVDPAGPSLDAARSKTGASLVHWLHGISPILPTAAFDVAVMTSHVAQFLSTDVEWDATFTDIHRALVPNGRLVFDSRDPMHRAWTRWNWIDSQRRVRLSDGREAAIWTEVTQVDGEPTPVVSFTHHYQIPEQDELTSESSLRFRDTESITTSLERLGFTIDAIFGGWSNQAVGAGDGELLVHAHRH